MKFEFIASVTLLEQFLSEGVGGIYPGYYYQVLSIIGNQDTPLQFDGFSLLLHAIGNCYQFQGILAAAPMHM